MANSEYFVAVFCFVFFALFSCVLIENIYGYVSLKANFFGLFFCTLANAYSKIPIQHLYGYTLLVTLLRALGCAYHFSELLQVGFVFVCCKLLFL